MSGTSMVTLAELASSAAEASAVVDRAVARSAHTPSLGLIIATEHHDLQQLVARMRHHHPELAVIATTTSGGMFTEAQLVQGASVGVALVCDPLMDSGAAFAAFGDDSGRTAFEAARMAMSTAIEQADRAGELPDMVVLCGVPGAEEQLVDGVRSVVGDSVHLIGGTAADDTIAGRWQVAGPEGSGGQGVALLAVYSEQPPVSAHQCGYLPTTCSAVITSGSGRVIQTLDHRPATVVYNEWLEETMGTRLSTGSILDATALTPLGRITGQHAGSPIYSLAHPAHAHADGSLELFAEIEPGQKIILLRGTRDALIQRAGRTMAAAMGGDICSGALMTFCAGCSIAVSDRLSEVVEQVGIAASARPVLGWFTFGEQGPRRGRRRLEHANLMLAAVAFPATSDGAR